MAYEIMQERVWVGEIEDRAGGLAEKLDVIADAGVDLEFMVSRRCPDKPGAGLVFLTGFRGDGGVTVAHKAGFTQWNTATSLRIHGPDAPKLGAKITRAVADTGVSLRGVSAATLGEQVVFQLAFDNTDDAETARAAISKALNG